MTREINGRIVMRVSDDGTRCAAECPHLSSSWCECTSFRAVVMRHEGGYLRAAACIAAEHAAASVPSCEGARGLDASEALREARVQGMREALEAMRAILKEDVWGTPYIDLDDAEEALDAAIEAVRKGER